MSALDNLKEVINLAKKINNIELQKEIINLQTEVFTLIQENQNLKGRINDFENKEEIASRLTFKENTYWKGSEGPFCSNCWDSKKTLVRIHTKNNFSGTCPSCNIGVVFDIQKYNDDVNEQAQALANMNNSRNEYFKW